MLLRKRVKGQWAFASIHWLMSFTLISVQYRNYYQMHEFSWSDLFFTPLQSSREWHQLMDGKWLTILGLNLCYILNLINWLCTGRMQALIEFALWSKINKTMLQCYLFGLLLTLWKQKVCILLLLTRFIYKNRAGYNVQDLKINVVFFHNYALFTVSL